MKKFSLDKKANTTIASNKRRGFIKGSAALVGTALLSQAFSSSASPKKSGSEADIQYLFVQNANHISIVNNQLRLADISSTTIFFSDRPQRIAGHMHTDDFVEDWQKGNSKESFHDDPPNATLSVFKGDEIQDVVMTLKNPRMENATLIYDIDILEQVNELKPGAGSLFIDPIGQPLSPGSIAGVRRRQRRRVRRAVILTEPRRR